MASTVRVLMVASVVHRALAKLLVVLGISDVTVSEVKVSPDLSHAKVYVCPLMGGDFDKLLSTMVELRPLLERKLRKDLSFRVPTLDFRSDHSYQQYDKIDRALKSAVE